MDAEPPRFTSFFWLWHGQLVASGPDELCHLIPVIHTADDEVRLGARIGCAGQRTALAVIALFFVIGKLLQESAWEFTALSAVFLLSGLATEFDRAAIAHFR